MSGTGKHAARRLSVLPRESCRVTQWFERRAGRMATTSGPTYSRRSAGSTTTGRVIREVGIQLLVGAEHGLIVHVENGALGTHPVSSTRPESENVGSECSTSREPTRLRSVDYSARWPLADCWRRR